MEKRSFEYVYAKRPELFYDFKNFDFIKTLKVKDPNHSKLSVIFKFENGMAYHILRKISPFYYKMRGYSFEEMIDLIDFREVNCCSHPQYWLNINCSLLIALKHAKDSWDLNLNLPKKRPFKYHNQGQIGYWEERLDTEDRVYAESNSKEYSKKMSLTLSEKVKEEKRLGTYKQYNPYSVSDQIEKHNYTTEEAILAIKNKKEIDRFNSIWCKEYWISRGYSEEQAAANVSEEQRKNCSKYFEKTSKEERRKNSKLCPEYWIDKGLTDEEIKLQLSKNGRTFSLDICIEKYGEELGTLIWKDRQEQWLIKCKENPEYDIIQTKKDSVSIEWSLKKCDENLEKAEALRATRLDKTLGNIRRFSKESIKYFNPIVDYVNKTYPNLTILWKDYEFFLIPNHPEFNRFYYDFTILEINYIIEYHGKAFHAKDLNFKPIFDKEIPPEFFLLKEEIKTSTAKSAGFDIDVVWSDTLIDQNIIMRKIDEKYENYTAKIV